MPSLSVLSTLTSGRDSLTSTSLNYNLRDKKKKGQQEKDRQANIQSQNLIMLQHLSDIARSKRIDDGNMKKANWRDFYLQIIVNPR